MNTNLSIKWHCAECQHIFGNYVDKFVTLFGTNQKLEKFQVGISGRILRGIKESDFVSLTDNSDRRVIFLLGADSLADLVGLNGREILTKIGYDKNFVNDLLATGTQFKLVILPESKALLATWDNVLDIVKEAYPEWESKIEIARPIFKSNNNYEDVMSMGGIPSEVRAFLHDTINVNRLFSGDGFTRKEDDLSKAEYAEFIARNRQLDDFGAYALIDFPVS